MTEELKSEIERLKTEAAAALREFHAKVSREDCARLIGDTAAAVLVNRDSIICYATRPLEQMFGYEANELEGEHVSILIPQRFHEAHEHHTDGYMDQPTRRQMSDRPDLTALHASGKEFRVNIELRSRKEFGTRYFIAEVFQVKTNA